MALIKWNNSLNGELKWEHRKRKTETLRLFLQICHGATALVVAFGNHPLALQGPIWWTDVEGSCRNRKLFPILITSRAATPLIIRNKKNRLKAKLFFFFLILSCIIYPWWTEASMKFTRNMITAVDSSWKIVVCGWASDCKTLWKKHKANHLMKWQQEFIAGGSCQIGVNSYLNLTSAVNPYLEKVLFKPVLSCCISRHHI